MTKPGVQQYPANAKPKRKPRGRPFPKGVSQRRNVGGKPFIKMRQRFSVLVAETISEQASPEDCELAGLPENSTKGKCVVEMMYRMAMAGDVSAAHFLYTCTESARVLIENLNVTNVALIERARDKLIDVMAGRELPQEVER
jgi:hypothetical protein